MIWRYLFIAICVLASGCATQGVNTFSHNHPSPTVVKNEILVNKPYNEVWDKLVKEVSKSFYVINNIDKESRIINLSFGTNSPSEYIDCGSTKRIYTQGDKKEVFEYLTADSSMYKMATPKQPNKNFSFYGIVDRKTTLEGRSNIYVAPAESDKNKTILTVNTRYIWTLKMNGTVYAEHFSGNNTSQLERLPEQTTTIMFNTNTAGKSTDTKEPITCYSRGKLESEILGMVSK